MGMPKWLEKFVLWHTIAEVLLVGCVIALILASAFLSLFT